MIKHENDHYRLRIRNNGLIRLSIGGVEVIDRGLMNEIVDRTHWGTQFAEFKKTCDPNERDTDTGLRNRALFNDRYKRDLHYLQHFGHWYAVTSKFRRERRITIRGVLGTRSEREGAIEFKNFIQMDDSPLIRIHVRRKYLHAMSRGGDGSLCFLSPGGFAKRFAVHGDPESFAVRREGMDWADLTDVEKKRHDHPGTGTGLDYHEQSGVLRTSVPTRCRVNVRDGRPIWGCLLGKGAGFGLIVRSYDSRGEGELRCTRPRPPAENKFDEIEFQFAPNGPRIKGEVETGEFILVPCRSWEDVHEVFEAESK